MKFRVMLFAAVCLAAGIPHHTMAQENGNFEKLPLGKDRELKVVIKSTGRCVLGDMDAISLDMNDLYERNPEDGTEVMLTLEPLTAAFPGQIKLMSGGEVSPQEGVTLTVPALPTPAFAGLFICLGKRNAAGCKDKAAMNYDQILSRHRVTIDASSGNAHAVPNTDPPSEKIYFFRYMLVAGNDIYYSPKGMTEEDYKAANRLAAKLSGGKSDYSRDIDELKKLAILGSVPLRVEGGALVIDIPHYDGKKCGG